MRSGRTSRRSCERKKREHALAAAVEGGDQAGARVQRAALRSLQAESQSQQQPAEGRKRRPEAERLHPGGTPEAAGARLRRKVAGSPLGAWAGTAAALTVAVLSAGAIALASPLAGAALLGTALLAVGAARLPGSPLRPARPPLEQRMVQTPTRAAAVEAEQPAGERPRLGAISAMRRLLERCDEYGRHGAARTQAACALMAARPSIPPTALLVLLALLTTGLVSVLTAANKEVERRKDLAYSGDANGAAQAIVEALHASAFGSELDLECAAKMDGGRAVRFGRAGLPGGLNAP
ncbi:hypothetical protein HYH03_012520 [Edaphochlamys debaryana]|uniref:Uncharacterized protein n=1 Tax=Edaphochlamys debaryana TaxID=47281 RepID=A0A836BU02_9CHLO|nr:hypothetical protein HYH03_012520 [Edaphochlamys debaryana]|eukprot:KAG2488890.1 hypothetical protein HYH03_012520 [Edaphochlamys debaryana]